MTFKLKLQSLGYVVASLGGAVGSYLLVNDKKANMSWTTNHTPSVLWDWNWDKREPSSLVKPSHHPFNSSTDQNNNALECPPKRKSKSSPTRHLIFVRHGQYNLEGLTDEDKILSQLGREQASLTGERLKVLPFTYTRLVYSTMTRATETALIMQDKLSIKNVEKCDLLREGAPIPPEPPIGNWKAEMHKYFIDGSRIEAAFRKYFHRAPPSQTEDSFEIFVCHGNVIRYFVCRALQLPPEAWLRMSLNNGSITYFTIRPDGRVALRLLGDCGFMSPEKLSLN